MEFKIKEIGKDGDATTCTVQNRTYLDFNPLSKVRRRWNCELVVDGGWIHVDHGEDGQVVGIEIVAGDPYGGNKIGGPVTKGK
jgi:hypothetical protein